MQSLTEAEPHSLTSPPFTRLRDYHASVFLKVAANQAFSASAYEYLGIAQPQRNH